MTLNKTIYTCQFNSPIGTLIFRYSVIRKPVKNGTNYRSYLKTCIQNDMYKSYSKYAIIKVPCDQKKRLIANLKILIHS